MAYICYNYYIFTPKILYSLPQLSSFLIEEKFTNLSHYIAIYIVSIIIATTKITNDDIGVIKSEHNIDLDLAYMYVQEKYTHASLPYKRSGDILLKLYHTI